MDETINQPGAAVSSRPCVAAASWIGCGALILWAVEAAMVAGLGELPLFFCMALIFFSSFAFTAIRLTFLKRWSIIRGRAWWIWLVGMGGICGSDLLYVWAARHAPIAHVDLIDTLWPLLLILFVSFMPGERLRFKNIAGAVMAFTGVLLLLDSGAGLGSYHPEYGFGYFLAITGTLLWAGYCVYSRHMRERLPSELVGIYCLPGAVICLFIHLSFETWRVPTGKEFMLTFILGVTGAGLAYQLWDYGSKYGNVYLLSILTYLTPIISMTLLVVTGEEPFSWALVWACLAVTIGVGISSVNWQELWQTSVMRLKLPFKTPIKTPLPVELVENQS